MVVDVQIATDPSLYRFAVQLPHILLEVTADIFHLSV